MDPQKSFITHVTPILSIFAALAETHLFRPDQLDAAGTALAEHALAFDGVAASALAEHALGEKEGMVLPYEARLHEGWGQNGANPGAAVELQYSVQLAVVFDTDGFRQFSLVNP